MTVEGKNRRAAIGLVLTLFACTAELPAAQAQTPAWPTRPVRVVVPYPPAGTTDLVGRVIAQELGKKLGQNFIIDNRGGASGQIGTEIAAKAAPDGYTLLVAASGNTMMQTALSPTLPYDVNRDFAAIGNIVNVANLLVVSAGSRLQSLNGLVEFAKNNPDKVRYASGGVGSSGHVAGALLIAISGINMLHVPYRGGGLSILSVIAGETDVNFINLPTALPHTRSGKLRGLAVLSTKRAAVAPEYATTPELGMPGLIMTSSTGLLATRATPGPIIARLEKMLRAMADDRDIVRQFTELGADIDYMDAAQYGKYIRDEIRRFAALGKQANIVIQ